MTYGSQIWGQHSNVYIEKLFKLQNSAMRIIEFQANPNPIYKENRILKLDDYVTLQNCLFVHDCLNNKSPIKMFSIMFQ